MLLVDTGLRSQKNEAPSDLTDNLTISRTPGDLKSDALRGHKFNGRRPIFVEYILQKVFKGSEVRRLMSGRCLCDS